MGWKSHLFSLEIRKQLSYRVDFWAGFIGQVCIELAIAYFLWKEVYQSKPPGVLLGGYSFSSIMLYYLLLALSRQVIAAVEFGFLSMEIYDGSLNRYLVYPVSFFVYKYVSWMAAAAVSFVRLAVSFAAFVLIFGWPADRSLALQGLVQGTLALWGASTAYFFMASILDLVAFWAENVWSLQVMLRFISLLLGGGLIPLSFFPAWSMGLLAALPFPYMISFPVRCFLGEVNMKAWSGAMTVLLVWSLVFMGVTGWLWRRGTRQYSGVGI